MRWLGGLLLGALVVVGLLTLLGQGPRMPGLGLGSAPADEPVEMGYVARGARLVQTDENGVPQYVLEADIMRQTPDSRDVHADGLDVRYDPRSDSPPWRLTARNGVLPAGSTRVQLRGEVRLVGRLPGASQDTQLETPELDFDLHEHIAESRQSVVLRSDAGRLSARGFTANLKQGTLRLESSVHGRFSP